MSLLDNIRAKLFGNPALQQTNVNSELLGAGVAFGALIEGVGKAVADSQREMDASAGNIATVMATTQVPIVQAVVTNYDDSGNIVGVNVVQRNASAFEILPVTGLSFKRVHLEGSFVATEFSSAGQSNVNINLIGANVGFGRGRFGASGSVSNSNTDVQSEQTQDSSVGNMSLQVNVVANQYNAPTTPPLIMTGPKLTLTAGPMALTQLVPNPVSPTDPPASFRRQIVVMLQLMNTKPSAVLEQTVAIDFGGLGAFFCDSGGNPPSSPTPSKTDSSGVLYFAVTRTVASSTDPSNSYTISASMNLVKSSLSISL